VARDDWEVVNKEGELFKSVFPQFTTFYDQMVELLRRLKEGRL
jgi:hypothetical protein